MHIEILGAEYADDIYRIEKSSFKRPWSRENILSELEKSDSLFLGIIHDGELAGYLSISIILDEGYLLNVAVLQKYRNKGMATALFEKLFCIAEMKKLSFITLEVRSRNYTAVSLYEKLGFEKAGLRKSYYSDPSDDAVLMTKKLEVGCEDTGN